MLHYRCIKCLHSLHIKLFLIKSVSNAHVPFPFKIFQLLSLLFCADFTRITLIPYHCVYLTGVRNTCIQRRTNLAMDNNQKASSLTGFGAKLHELDTLPGANQQNTRSHLFCIHYNSWKLTASLAFLHWFTNASTQLYSLTTISYLLYSWLKTEMCRSKCNDSNHIMANTTSVCTRRYAWLTLATAAHNKWHHLLNRWATLHTFLHQRSTTCSNEPLE